ncbi:TPA: hypothetical protein ACGY72_002570 [Stenotrophomonas maltophilia]
MSNDNRTLADVQPGGRVRLGDQAERARFKAWWDAARPLDGSAFPYEIGWAAWQAALSAQPSPGGQDALPAQAAWMLPDDARLVGVIADNIERGKLDHPGFYRNTQLAEALRRVLGAAQSGQRFPCGQLDDNDLLTALSGVENYLYYGDSNPIHTATVRAAINALAARQPVGEPPMEMRICELRQVSLKPDRPYIFTVDANCANCRGDAAYAMGHTDTRPAQAVDLGTGIKAIASERERQLCIEGFSRDSDEQYREGELARAATAYVQLAAMDLQVGSRKHIASQEPPFFWPWAPEWWKPVDARHDLVRAGALIAAQIDLIDSQAVGNG